jgi:hypothetical protein
VNSEQVEAAVVAYLAAGADEAVAGKVKENTACPVWQACTGKHSYDHTVVARSLTWLYSWQWGPWDQIDIPHTPTVRRFVALVDAEQGPTVTFARARTLWGKATEAG